MIRALLCLAAGRSPRWPKVRAAHLKANPECAACGRLRNLEAHHILPVHVAPERELVAANLITLCADPCHLVHGHLMDFDRYDPNVTTNAAIYRARLSGGPS